MDAMNILKIISPANNSVASIENFDSKTEFSKLTKVHKAITLIATGAVSLVTLGFATSSYFHKLVGRFRKLELDEQGDSSITKVTQAASVASLSASKITPQLTGIKDETPARSKPLPDVQKPGCAQRLEPQPLEPLKEPIPVARPTPVAASKPKAPQKPLPPPPKAPSQKSIQQPATDYNQIENNFWEDHFRNEKLHRALQMAAINGGDDLQTVAEGVIANYVSYKKMDDPFFALSPAHRTSLIQSVSAQLVGNEHPKQASVPKISQHGQTETLISNVLDLSDGQQLIVYATGDDGSCALHALLGVPVNGVYKTDAAGRRKAFCDWLENQHKQHQLHERAQNILDDFFDNFKNAPSTFQNAVRDKYLQYREEFDKLGKARENKMKRDAIKEAFIYDPEVFQAYRAELMNINRYMLQEELIMAAECFGYKLEIFQPEWNAHAGEALREVGNVVSGTFNMSAPGKKVNIWYNGYNHYEYATIVT